MQHKSVVPLLKKLFVTICAGFILCIGACSDDNSSAPAPASSIKHVIVDTDVDSDDAMAILYLMNAAGVKLDALTVTGTGFMLQVDGVPVALKLVDLGGATETPVSYGANTAILPFGGFPDEWRESALKFYADAGLPDIKAPPDPLSSAQLLVELIRNAPDKVTILGLGPMTNIALALQMAPDIADNIERIVMSAGAFAPHLGNIVTVPPQTTIEETASYRTLAALSEEENTAEYNVLLDVQAFSVILQSGVSVLISPLNASTQAPVSDTVLDPLKNLDRLVARFIVGVIQPLLDQQVPTYFWDPVAASMVVDPAICTNRRKVKVMVEIGDDQTFGTTVESPYGNEVDVCFDIDAERFYNSFIETIKAAP